MSLINQALKKEQQRRSLNLNESISDIPTYDSGNLGNGLSPSVRQNNRSLSILLGFTGVGAFLLILGIGVVYFGKSYLNQLNSTPMVSQADTGTSFAAEPPETPETNVTSTESEIQAEGKDPLTEIVTSIDVADVESPAEPAPETELGETDGTETPESPEEEPALAEAEVSKPEYDFKIQNLIDEFQVLGYRSAGANSRLLMNGRVFKLNDIVDNERGLRFIGSNGESIVFETPSGYRYYKPL
jgi:hypothetical protein